MSTLKSSSSQTFDLYTPKPKHGRKSKIEDIMIKDPPLIYQKMSLTKVLEVFSHNPYLYYPVVNDEKELVGLISVHEIKNTFMVSGLDDFLLADDIMEPVIAVTSPQSPMTNVRDLLDKNNLDCMPVINKEKKVVGFLDLQDIQRLISQKIAELHEEAEKAE